MVRPAERRKVAKLQTWTFQLRKQPSGSALQISGARPPNGSSDAEKNLKYEIKIKNKYISRLEEFKCKRNSNWIANSLPPVVQVVCLRARLRVELNVLSSLLSHQNRGLKARITKKETKKNKMRRDVYKHGCRTRQKRLLNSKASPSSGNEPTQSTRARKAAELHVWYLNKWYRQHPFGRGCSRWTWEWRKRRSSSLKTSSSCPISP